jgi:hypothetical protein
LSNLTESGAGIFVAMVNDLESFYIGIVLHSSLD